MPTNKRSAAEDLNAAKRQREFTDFKKFLSNLTKNEVSKVPNLTKDIGINKGYFVKSISKITQEEKLWLLKYSSITSLIKHINSSYQEFVRKNGPIDTTKTDDNSDSEDFMNMILKPRARVNEIETITPLVTELFGRIAKYLKKNIHQH